MANESTISKLIEMRLSPMAQTYREQQERVDICTMSFDERFSMLVDAEWDTRRINKRTRLLRSANFSVPGANVCDVSYDADRKLDKTKIMELANATWIDECLNLIITGSTGSGKSWLACALGVAACNAFKSVKYVRMPEMLDELTVSKDDIWIKAKKRYITCNCLIIDDWCLEPIDGREARELLEIIEARYRSGSTILCSQFAPAGWHAKLGEGAIADAVVDRLAHNAYRIHIEGTESMRKRMSPINA